MQLEGVSHNELLIVACDVDGQTVEKGRTTLSGSSYNGENRAHFGSQGKVASLEVTISKGK